MLKRTTGKDYIDYIELLLETGAPITRMSFSSGLESTLIYIIIRGQNRAIKLLLNRDATISKISLTRETPFYR